MRKLNDAFLTMLDEKKFLIVLHRGAHGGNIVENTVAAAKIANKQKVDIVEIDISMSIDGDFFIFHDGEEKKLLNEERNINTLTTEEIESKFYYNELCKKLHKKVERAKDFFEQVPSGIFLNIDRSWDHWETFIPFLDNYETLHPYFVLKSPVKKEFLDILEKHNVKYMYFPIIYNLDELDLLETYKNINLVGFEIIENGNKFEFINSERFDKYKQGDYMFLANSINLDDDTKLFGPLCDDAALLGNPDEVWGKMLDMGINAIQTDWADFLYQYRQSLFGEASENL